MAGRVYNLTEHHQYPSQVLRTGIVLSCDPLRVRSDIGVVDCRVAASCLLAPAVRDEVLIFIAGAGHAYLLSILERDTDVKSEIVLQGDAGLKASGRLSLSAARGVDLASATDVSILSSTVNVAAKRGEIAIDEVSHSGSSLTAALGRIKVVATVFESVVETVSEWVARAFRRVDHSEHISVRSTQYHCDELFTLDSRNAILMAEELTKIDADQIHLG